MNIFVMIKLDIALSLCTVSGLYNYIILPCSGLLNNNLPGCKDVIDHPAVLANKS